MRNQLTISREDKSDIPAFNKIFARYLLKGSIVSSSIDNILDYAWSANVEFTTLTELAEFSKAFVKECAKGLPTL